MNSDINRNTSRDIKTDIKTDINRGINKSINRDKKKSINKDMTSNKYTDTKETCINKPCEHGLEDLEQTVCANCVGFAIPWPRNK